jgi:dihydroorotase
VLHVSTARACELIADAKRRGVRVTGEVTPHHLILTEDAIGEFDTMARVSPPLRSAEDRAALREAIRSGVLDCIATDHAPHTDIEKELPFDTAPPGMIGLDFAFALLYTELVDTGFMDLMTLLRRMTCAPADIVRLEAGRLAAGAPADIIVIDLQGETRIAPDTIHSKSRNTPFMGRTLRSRIAHTFVGGQPVHSGGRILADALAVR